jgi:hypothetical protein
MSQIRNMFERSLRGILFSKETIVAIMPACLTSLKAWIRFCVGINVDPA